MKPRALNLPEWVEDLPLAVWVTDEKMRLTYLNRAAERLLHRSETDLGCRCFDVVSGRDRSGELVCRPDCAARAAIREARPIDGIDLTIGPDANWVRLFVAPLEGGSGARPIVHVAVEMDREQSAESFVERIASRTVSASAARLAGLSEREREVLRLLAEDKTTRAVADELNISYVTVRNHIQHILAKMDAHSILEATACWVLAESDED